MTPIHAGIGWRPAHFDELLNRRPPLGFIEVHTEEFFGANQAALDLLERGRACYELSLHGTGLLLDSGHGINDRHLGHVLALAERFEPWIISDHASPGAGSMQRVAHQAPGGPRPSPQPFSDAALRTLCDHVSQVQDRLRRVIAIENLMFDMRGQGHDMDEATFLTTLTQRTGCLLLVDINNIYVNALNEFRHEIRQRFDAPPAGQALPVTPLARCQAWLDAVPMTAVAELHVSGYQDFGNVVINDHSSAASEPVWSLYRHAIRRFGQVPTLIEWDNNIPPLHTLLDEAIYADRLNDETLMACANTEPAATGLGCHACVRA